ncbi:rCG64194 [Rattus norvegicus]|uniref:RCG64194 n=1 Tax=Rattus norvegicus TaxID=10116 RepID=A6KGA5_RAT|nr:rCG64194 [Rattus norvegicus]
MGKGAQLRPKVNVFSYIEFMLDFRREMNEQQPNTYHDFAEFSRKSSEKWHHSQQKWRSILKHDKAKYEALAKLCKDRYKEEMRNYTGTRRKKRRDDMAPWKPPSSLLLFSLDHFDQQKKENTNWTVVEMAKAARKMWSMSANLDKIPMKRMQ